MTTLREEKRLFIEFAVKQFGLDENQVRWHGADLPIIGMRDVSEAWLGWKARANYGKDQT